MFRERPTGAPPNEGVFPIWLAALPPQATVVIKGNDFATAVIRRSGLNHPCFQSGMVGSVGGFLLLCEAEIATE